LSNKIQSNIPAVLEKEASRKKNHKFWIQVLVLPFFYSLRHLIWSWMILSVRWFHQFKTVLPSSIKWGLMLSLTWACSRGLVVKAEDSWLRSRGFKPPLWRPFYMHHSFGLKHGSKNWVEINLALLHML